MFPEIRTTAPNSPTARANASATPERIAGSRFGKTMRRKTARRPAPSEDAASSISRSSSISTGCTARTTNGNVTKRSASTSPARWKATSTPKGLFGPYRVSSVSPATIVGNANGRSMTALTNSLPRKSSRTSTQAIIVPVAALKIATNAAHASVSFSAAIDCGFVTSAQNVSHPCDRELQTRAASGTRTTRLR